MEPKIVDRDRIVLVGLPYFGDASEGKFGQAWHRFMQHDMNLTNRVNEHAAYGVEYYGPEFHEEHKWHYFPSVEVSDLNDFPTIFFAKILPAAQYAVFTSTGGLSKLSETFQYAYMTWLPASEYEVAHPFDFEYYGERYRGDVPESEVDIYIPIKPKA